MLFMSLAAARTSIGQEQLELLCSRGGRKRFGRAVAEANLDREFSGWAFERYRLSALINRGYRDDPMPSNDKTYRDERVEGRSDRVVRGSRRFCAEHSPHTALGSGSLRKGDKSCRDACTKKREEVASYH